MTWTPERDALLLAQIAAGLSAKAAAVVISAAIGETVSRNAAIGRAHRLKLSFRGNVPAAPGGRTHKKRALASTRPVNLLAILQNVKAKRVNVSTGAPLADVEPVELVDLEPHQCRWPLGDGPFLFCGAPKDGERVYCAHHAAKAFYKPATTPSRFAASLRRYAA